jgi:hypothetical protein
MNTKEFMAKLTEITETQNVEGLRTLHLTHTWKNKRDYKLY